MLRGLFAIAIAALAFSVSTAFASEFGTREEAVAMVRTVQEKFRTAGGEATFKAVNDHSTKEFHDRDLYPFIYDLSGLNVAHGARPALVGKNLITLTDQDGKFLIQEMVGIANGSGHGWIDYKWPNPISNKIEDKSSYVEKMGDYFVGVGVYRSPTREDAIAMAKRVQEKFQKDGAEATFAAVTDKSTPEFHEGELYPFIYDLSGVMMATGGHTALIGKNLAALTDADGKAFVRDVLELANGPGSGWVNYKFPNPFTGATEDKSTYIQRMGEYFVCVGIWRIGGSK